MKIKIVMVLILLLYPPFVYCEEITAQYNLAKDFMARGRHEEAIALLEELANSDYIIKDYVLYDLANSYQKCGLDELALQRYRWIIDAYKSSPLYKQALREAFNLCAKGHLDCLESLGKEYIASFDDNVAQEIMKFFEKSLQMSRWEKHLKEIFLRGGDNFDYAYKIMKRHKIPLSKEEIKEGLSRAYRKGNFRKIISLLDEEELEDEEITLILGKCYFMTRQYFGAIRHLINSPLREGRIILAWSLLRVNDRISAEIVLNRLASYDITGLYELFLTMAELKRREGRKELAESEFKRLFSLYPEQRQKTLWHLSWLHIRAKEYDKAKAYLEEALSISGEKEKDQILFWLAKLEEYKGLSGERYLSQLNPKSYYGVKVGKLTKDLLKKRVERCVEGEAREGEAKKALLRAYELQRVAMFDYSVLEIKNAINEFSYCDIPDVAKLLFNADSYDLLLQLVERYGDISEFSFPLAYIETIKKFAQSEGVDPYLILAIMREESRFRKSSISVAGAIGLMQVMPKTARHFVNFTDLNELYELEKNILAGVKYISKLCSDFKNVVYVISAYNAGEHRVREWLKNSYRDDDEFIEDIPFKETRNYVKKVMRSYYIYKLMYGKGF